MKRLLTIYTIFVLCICLLAGCNTKKKNNEQLLTDSGQKIETPIDSSEISDEKSDEVTELEDDKNNELEDSQENVIIETPSNGSKKNPLPYLQKVSDAGQSIFKKPGYDYEFVGTVEVAATYTIVEEVKDDEGNLWGKLKSGAGWIDLTEVNKKIQNPEPISANFADERLLKSKQFHYCIGDDSEYAIEIAFRANENIRDVSFYSMIFEEKFEKDKLLYETDELTPERPLVTKVNFPGDMTKYGISFTDSKGKFRTFTISLSGRNGTVFLLDETP